MKGVCCVHILNPGAVNMMKHAYVYNTMWPKTENGSEIREYDISWQPDTCFLRLEMLTLELAETDGNCVHDRLTIIGGKKKSGNLCGDRSGEVTMVEPDHTRSPVKLVIMTQSDEWRYDIGITQVK